MKPLLAIDNMIDALARIAHRLVKKDRRTGIVMKYRIEKELLVAARPDTLSLVRWVEIELMTAVQV